MKYHFYDQDKQSNQLLNYDATTMFDASVKAAQLGKKWKSKVVKYREVDGIIWTLVRISH